MAEIRLSKLIKIYNIGLDTLVDFLNSKGAEIDSPSVNMKVSDVFLPELEKKFGRDKAIKEAVDQEGFLESEMVRRLGNVKLTPSSELHPKSRKLDASVAPEEFDWDAFENDGAVPESKEEVLAKYKQVLSKVPVNEIVEGLVTSINKREVTVNIGTSEGIIFAPEFRYNPSLKVGDKVKVLVESAENRKGQLILSHKKARQRGSWDMINAAYESGEIVVGYVKKRTKGGMIVDVFGIEAFLPSSQMDIKPIFDYDVYIDTTMDLKIVKINQEFLNVVVSHKRILEEEREKKRLALKSTLKKGQILEGKVKSIVNFGIFVDLDGVDGLIHISNLGENAANELHDVYTPGQSISVKVLDYDDELERISLGLAQNSENAKPQKAISTASIPKDDISLFNDKALELIRRQKQ